MLSVCHASIIGLILLFGGSNANPAVSHQSKSDLYPKQKLDINHKKPLQTFRPYNVAHRGSSGILPEETTAAYLRAIEEDADFIEADIVASKDGHLICFHDVILDATTDIANHTEFANRKRTYEVERVNMTGFFVVDFTLVVRRLVHLRDGCDMGSLPELLLQQQLTSLGRRHVRELVRSKPFTALGEPTMALSGAGCTGGHLNGSGARGVCTELMKASRVQASTGGSPA